jgi:hypothetical protein
LAQTTGSRRDLSFDLLRQLLLRTTEAVRYRLLSGTPPALEQEMSRALRAARGNG